MAYKCPGKKFGIFPCNSTIDPHVGAKFCGKCGHPIVYTKATPQLEELLKKQGQQLQGKILYRLQLFEKNNPDPQTDKHLYEQMYSFLQTLDNLL